MMPATEVPFQKGAALDQEKIFAIERPHKNLLKLYLIRVVLSGPFAIFTFPLLFFRYQTMRYSFDEEGVHMKWGLLFRREINLTYSRIQDIHLTSGIIQRWLGLADLQIQTASGSAAAEMTIEGMLEFEEIRDFLYRRMRGNRDKSGAKAPSTSRAGASLASSEALELLREIHRDLRATREALEERRGGESADV